jgi:hypothetical protein
MKKIIIFILFTAVSLQFAKAQDEELYPLSIGPLLSGKLGISGVDTPLGRKNGLAVSPLPDMGITAYLPTNTYANLGALLSLEVSSYSFIMQDVDKETDYQHNLQYVTFSISFYFDKFWLGFGTGLNVGANYEGVEIDTDIINTMYDVRIGFMYPIYYDKDARLNVFIEGSYMLKGIYDDFVDKDPLKDIIPEKQDERITNIHNPRVAAVRIGFNYMFQFWNKAE